MHQTPSDEIFYQGTKARRQLEASERRNRRGGRGHSREKHAAVSLSELQQRAMYVPTVTAYKSFEDQEAALASAFKTLQPNLSMWGTVRAIPKADRIKTDPFEIFIATRKEVKLGWSTSMTIIRDQDVCDNNIVTAYPIPNYSLGVKRLKIF